MDLSKLISRVTTRTAAGIAVAALLAGTGSAVVLTTHPTSAPQTQTVVGDEHSSSTSDNDTSETADATTESSDQSNGSSTSNHGQVVSEAVESCKSSAAAAHTHGIGDCVSDVASTNGQSHRHTSTTESGGPSH